jgi:hypothetical protein
VKGDKKVRDKNVNSAKCMDLIYCMIFCFCFFLVNFVWSFLFIFMNQNN